MSATAQLVGSNMSIAEGQKIETIVQRLCDIGARAVHRYVEVSGMDPYDMPEYFMPSFILDHLGDKVTMTLETSFAKLLEWNEDARKRSGLPERKLLVSVVADLGAPRVDLVLYKDPHRRKNEQDLLALVEFKRGWISGAHSPTDHSDQAKVRRLLQHIDICRYGIVCGWARLADRDWAHKGAMETGDKWFESEFEVKDDRTQYFFCARLVESAAASGSMK